MLYFTLGDARVVHAMLVHLHSVVLQVEQDVTLPNPILLFTFLMHHLLEIGIEPENLR